MFDKTDVLIIGAGPAGLTAARILSESEVSYRLITQETSPCENKTCGGYIPQSTLERFGLDLDKVAYPVKSIRMKFPGTEMKQVDFKRTIGVNVTRPDLGHVMLQRISEADSCVHLSSRASKIRLVEGGVITRLHFQDESYDVKSKLVIDASGVNPVSQRSGLVRERIPNDSMGYAVQFQLRSQSGDSKRLPPRNDFYWGSEYSPRGYAWVFPRGNEVVVGTGGIVSTIRSDSRRVIDYLQHLVNDVSPTCEELADFEITRTESALMPLAGVVVPSYDNRILLAGDAAGHCSPISGEGIHYAMVAGKMAAERAQAAIKRNDFSKKFLSGYEKAWRRDIGSDLRWGRWLQRRFSKSGSGSMGSSVLSSSKSLRIIAEMLLGERSVRSAIIRMTPSYLKHKILG